MRRHRLIHHPAVAVAGAGTIAAAMALLPAPGMAATGPPGWTSPPPVPVPAGATSSALQDVSVRASDDVWAVGGWWAPEVHPFVVHWDGRTWTIASLPALPQATYLTGVDAVGPADVWVAGSVETQPGDLTPDVSVLLHFDGSTWTQLPVPMTAAGVESDLDDIDMGPSGDGWAVGHTVTGGQLTQPYILHWRSGQWIQTPAPKMPDGSLTSVVDRAADDAWAVGSQRDADGVTSPLVLHWDGRVWTRDNLLAPPGSTVVSVGTDPVGNVWVGGSTCVSVCAPLVMHRSPTGWVPVPTAGGSTVTEVVPFSDTEVYTIGFTRSVDTLADHIERWDGQTFTAVDLADVPGPPGGSEIASAIPLAGASGDPTSGTLWAVGWSGDPGREPHVVYRK